MKSLPQVQSNRLKEHAMPQGLRLGVLLACVLGFSVASVGLSAQGQGQGRGNAGPQLRTLTQTFYTPRTEIFAVYRPYVVGQEGRFSPHLTRIEDHFVAMTDADAQVTLTLSVGGVVTGPVAATMDRPGAFRATFTPTKAGSGTITVNVETKDGAEKFVFENITVEPDMQTALAHQSPNNPDAGAIRYTKEEGWDGGNFATAAVTKVALQPGRATAVAVPLGAIIQEQGQPHVYVQRTPEAFDLRAVKTGASNAQFAEITEGLREGERIVVKGAGQMPRRAGGGPTQ
jgi:hypothetical protein